MMMPMSPVSFQGNPTPSKREKVVIVGNGIGGVATGRELNRLLKRNPLLADVTIIGPNDHFIFKPQLHESLNGKKLGVPMAQLFPKNKVVQYQQGTVTKVSIDPAKKELETANGPIPYDYLIIAVGGKTAYYGHDAAKTHAVPIEEPLDIEKIKSSALKKLNAAAGAPNNSKEQTQALSFVVVGGGATGVEFAFELDHFLKTAIREFPNLKNHQAKITIVEAMNDILNGFSDKEKAYVKKRLKERGIEVLYNHPVQKVGAEGLVLTDKNAESPRTVALTTETPIWVTGIRANPLVEALPVERLPGNQRVKVTSHLEIPNRPDIYVIGDTAAGLDAKTGKVLPPTGQVATQEGIFVAQDLFEKLKGKTPSPNRPAFTYQHSGSMFSIGPKDGFISWVKGIFLTGRIAHYTRQFVYSRKAKNP